MGLAEDDPDTKARLSGLRQGLENLGWSEGRNVRIDYRFSPAGARAQALARELVALKPNVIVSNATPATRALQLETNTIPIVFTGVTDPIGSGFIASLARPGPKYHGLSAFRGKHDQQMAGDAKGTRTRSCARCALVINPTTAPVL